MSQITRPFISPKTACDTGYIQWVTGAHSHGVNQPGN